MNLDSLKKYGIGINFPMFTAEVLEPIKEEQKLLADSIHSVIGYRNLCSSQQIKRGLNINGYGIKSVTIDELKAHREEAPIYKDLYRLKRNSAYLTQYDIHLRKQLDNDYRVHPTYSIATETTGRLKAINPAAMAFDAKLMSYLVPKPGCSLLHFDYKTMEFRVLAALSRDPILRRKLTSRNFDIHSENASLIFKNPVEKISAKERKDAKALGFAVIYGMSAQTLSQKLSCSTGTDITVEEAESYIFEFFNRYPFVQLYRNEILTGRRKCATLNGKEFTGYLRYSQKLNYPIQGTAAEAFIKVIDTLEDTYPQYHICLPVHDALYIEVPKQNAQEALNKISIIMESVMTNYLNVASYVDAEIVA